MLTYIAHSTSTDNETGIRSGWGDPPLSRTGVQQAVRLQRSLAGKTFDVIFTSDLTRAVQTAETVFRGQSVRKDPRLREINFGQLNGTADTVVSMDLRRHINRHFENGECCLDVQRRIQSFLDDCYSPNRSIAVVSHRCPQLALEVICKGLSWPEAIEQDWRPSGAWQPGWEYRMRSRQSASPPGDL